MFLSDLCSETAQSIDKISQVPSTSWALVSAERISRADYIARAVTCCPLTSTTILPRCAPVGDTAEPLSTFSPSSTLLSIADDHGSFNSFHYSDTDSQRVSERRNHRPAPEFGCPQRSVLASCDFSLWKKLTMAILMASRCLKSGQQTRIVVTAS